MADGQAWLFSGAAIITGGATCTSRSLLLLDLRDQIVNLVERLAERSDAGRVTLKLLADQVLKLLVHRLIEKLQFFLALFYQLEPVQEMFVRRGLLRVAPILARDLAFSVRLFNQFGCFIGVLARVVGN